MLSIDPALFRPDAISQETSIFNERLIGRLNQYAPQWQTPPEKSRAARLQGIGPFPLPPFSERAQTKTINGPGGPLSLRIIPPAHGRIEAAYLHIHGGGWVLGQSDLQDETLERIADNCGVVCVSVEYRLAPENPYPAAPDDCEAASLWLVENAKTEFDTECLLIGGESAGAHLSVVTLLRLRDKHGITPFSGANLVAGVYDLALTPSARNWGEERLILTTPDIAKFVEQFVGNEHQFGSPADPDISPIQASLHDLPAAHFSVGTRDCLLDDSIFMATRWLQAGNETDLRIYPGGCHVFQHMPIKLAKEANQEIDAFLLKCTSSLSGLLPLS